MRLLRYCEVFYLIVFMCCTLGVSAAAIQTKPNDMLYAVGEGAMPRASEQPNRAKAYLQAKAYAKMDAIASLAQAAKGTLISYNSKGNSYIANTVIKQEIKTILDSVQVVSAKKRAEGKDVIVEVTVRAPKPKLPKVPKAPPVEQIKPSKKPFTPSWLSENAGVDSVSSPNDGRGYTSVIIDAAGFKITRSMMPKILRPDGSEVWGTMKVDYDFVADCGLISYARNTADALANKRAGDKPLVLRAIGRGSSTAKCDMVISAADADTLIAEDRKSGFLSDFRVIAILN
jgi:hypothetical protein